MAKDDGLVGKMEPFLFDGFDFGAGLDHPDPT